uniref:Uncharacterized protein n=1 Tax=Meloidogyne enterolobii TaxID=390850 RepID=A0A6V7XAI7_MELEN|nr:unnamed protein product [Meloidogyne enterolobii]
MGNSDYLASLSVHEELRRNRKLCWVCSMRKGFEKAVACSQFPKICRELTNYF